MARLLLGALALLTLSALGAAGAGAATLQPVGSFREPIYVTSSPAAPNRLLVAQRDGLVLEVKNGAVSTFADARPVVDCCKVDRGLQSLALAPDFASSGRLYLDYTNADGDIVIAELRASGGSAALSSLRELMVIPFEPNANHYGGQIEIGPDGYLWIATGDGGEGSDGPGDEFHNAQNLGSLLGKILRIDPAPSGAAPYSVPPGNPFPAAAAPYDAIWSYGLRNPWRFSFDPPSGQVVIADVGEEVSEEVDMLAVGTAGANFGWNCVEGRLPGPATDPECAAPTAPFAPPAFEYGHKDTGGAWGCAIIGGYVVRGAGYGDLDGRYLYADFCTAAIRSFAVASPAGTDRPEGLSVGEVTSFGRDGCGRIYVVARSGQVSRLVGNGAQPCLIASRAKLKAAQRRVKRGARATLTVWVAPCEGRQGETVTLYRGKRRFGRAVLNKGCSARFHPRIGRRGGFRVKIGADVAYEAASTRRLVLSPLRP